MTLTESDKAL